MITELSNYIQYIDSSSFLSSLFAGLLVGLVIGVFFTMLYPRYLSWLKRSSIFFIFPYLPHKEFRIPKPKGEEKIVKIALAIENKSIELSQCVYWHLFTPSNLNPRFIYNQEQIKNLPQTPETSTKIPFQDNLGEWIHFSGIINGPIFAKRKFLFQYDITLKISNIGVFPIYYYFSTERGVCPAKAETFRFGSQLGEIGKYLNKLDIIVAEE